MSKENKRPLNRCGECGRTWHPRGSDRSRKCPACGSWNVSTVEQQSLGGMAGGTAAAGAGGGLVLVVMVCCGVGYLARAKPGPKKEAAAPPVAARPNEIVEQQRPESGVKIAPPQPKTDPPDVEIAEKPQGKEKETENDKESDRKGEKKPKPKPLPKQPPAVLIRSPLTLWRQSQELGNLTVRVSGEAKVSRGESGVAFIFSDADSGKSLVRATLHEEEPCDYKDGERVRVVVEGVVGEGRGVARLNECRIAKGEKIGE